MHDTHGNTYRSNKHVCANRCRRIALLVGGDLSALLIFAAIGRANHGESLDPASVVSVAWPFIAGNVGSSLPRIFSSSVASQYLPVTAVLLKLSNAAGWFGAASLLGGFGKAAQGGRVGPAALAALKAWAVGVPVNLQQPSLSTISIKLCHSHALGTFPRCAMYCSADMRAHAHRWPLRCVPSRAATCRTRPSSSSAWSSRLCS